MITTASGFEISESAPLKGLTSWLVGGSADYLAEPHSVDELADALQWSKISQVPVTILGGGTNVLISDKGVRGLTICLRKMSKLTYKEKTDETGEERLLIECLAGTSKSELLKTFIKFRLEPALFLAGLPGDVGGGVVMNAGVGEMFRPREFVEITDWVEVMRPDDFRIERIQGEQLQWSYRHCEGWQPGIVVRVGLSWTKAPSDDVLPRVKQANQTRLSKQPLDLPSCGSVFVNPVGGKAGQLIEQSGLKGFAIGGAKVSEKHANFIVNFNNATAQDIHGLIQHVQKTVLEKTKMVLKTEVVYLGEW